MPTKRERLAVELQLSLFAVQKANKCWMHTMPGYAVSNCGERCCGGNGQAKQLGKREPRRAQIQMQQERSRHLPSTVTAVG